MRIVITFQWCSDKSPSYLPLIKMAFESAKRFGYETVLVCNSNTEIADDLLILDEADEPYLMNWILAAQLAYIESDLFDQPTVIFSPDALILKRLEPVFDIPFDVAFTDRKNPRWPINNGVIYIKPEKRDQLAAMWRKLLEICKSYPIETQEWYGDQQSIGDAVKAGVHRDLGVHIELLPCEVYNASPMKPGQEFNKRLLKDAYVAHFKGKRKDAMKDYWRILCTKD